MRKHILIVDDEELFREICQEMLGERGYRVSVAEDAPAALAVLQSERVDLLVADITLPGIDGLTLIEQVRHTQPDLPAIVITGFLTQDNMLRSLNLGVHGFLTKPFFYDELFQSVERAIEDASATRNQLLIDHYLPLIRLGEEILAQDHDSLFGRTLNAALEIALMQTGATQGFVAVPEGPGGPQLAAASGFPPEDQPRLSSYLQQALTALNHTSTRPAAGDPHDVLSGTVIAGMECLLTRLPGVVPTGLLLLARPAADPAFSDEERKLAHLLAVQAAIALNQDKALRRSDKTGADLLALADLAAALVPAEAGFGASRRSELARLGADVARSLGCDSATQHAVHVAVLCHDLGKAFVPPALLAKPGPLTEAEWDQVRPYVTLGAERLARGGSLAAAATLVANHRERWDGRGYPRGRAEGEVSLAAYVVAAVTSWGAMLAPRPYRDPLPPEMAAEELRGHAGRSYHIEVVNTLLGTVGQHTARAGAGR
ncbi:MAG: response regulator [Nitrospirae bacterium]|nr:response regulator [Nitrospirota bacterium]